MKKEVRIAIVAFLLVLICVGGVFWMNGSNSSMVGQKVDDVRKKNRNDIILDASCLLAFKNSHGYTVVITNNEIVTAEIKYDKEATLVSKKGVDPLNAVVFEAGKPQTMQDMVNLFGSPHVDVGSGAYLPTYILDDGRIITYRMNEDNVVGSTIRFILDM